ncbi:helix-turn-helix domain-containing protein [Sneathiella chungangensis]|uniref:Helix-turn-helix domain-containing protein n=1 Tax=Sneathiella chungangensis TaxID=1418234 RepID=A0A845MQB6_9PROT|nr:helix-turn-helix transcriptional regulator [Sneathiella chungangensis]MZR24114.1 helix-turn-helix domain-containing protein [Sneathiella chungangensis]
MARAALKLTVRELGALSGVHATTVTRIENEQTKPHAASMQAFAKVFRERGLLFVAGDDLAGPGVRVAKSGLAPAE